MKLANDGFEDFLLFPRRPGSTTSSGLRLRLMTVRHLAGFDITQRIYLPLRRPESSGSKAGTRHLLLRDRSLYVLSYLRPRER